MKEWILYLLIALLFSPLAALGVEHHIDTTWGGLSLSDAQNKSRLMQATFLYQAEYSPSTPLTFYSGLLFNAQTGSNNAEFIDEYIPKQTWAIHQAVMTYRPTSFLSFSLGALNQGQWQAPLLLGNQAFAGAQEELHIKNDYMDLNLFLQQSIPTNQTLLSRLDSSEDGTPSLLLGGLRLTNKSLLIQGMFFSFNELGSSVAHYSRFMGNSILGTTTSNSRFLYGHQGFHALVKTQFPIGQFMDLKTGWAFLHNNKTPDKRSDGYRIFVDFDFKGFGLGTEYFLNESDSAPSFYNLGTYGHNNVQGLIARLFGTINQMDYEFIIVRSQVIDQNVAQALYQSERTSFQFNISRRFVLP